MNQFPKISIITVVFNGSDYIDETIKSVLDQDYPNFEYIIIDGGSTDNTVKIINKYNKKIDILISEKDNGIYDAMNKGIDIASGEWVLFMNCGDNFFDSKVLSNIFLTPIDTDIKLIYGGCKVRSDWGDFKINVRPVGEIWKSFTHQSIFSRIELNRKFKFNLDFKAASDYNFIYTVFSKGYKITPLNMFISDIQYISSGFSSVNELLSLKEVLRSIILNRNNSNSSISHFLYHLIALIRKYISIQIRLLSPNTIKMIRKFRDIKRHV